MAKDHTEVNQGPKALSGKDSVPAQTSYIGQGKRFAEDMIKAEGKAIAKLYGVGCKLAEHAEECTAAWLNGYAGVYEKTHGSGKVRKSEAKAIFDAVRINAETVSHCLNLPYGAFVAKCRETRGTGSNKGGKGNTSGTVRPLSDKAKDSMIENLVKANAQQAGTVAVSAVKQVAQVGSDIEILHFLDLSVVASMDKIRDAKLKTLLNGYHEEIVSVLARERVAAETKAKTAAQQDKTKASGAETGAQLLVAA